MNFSRAEPSLQTQGTTRRRRGESIQPMFTPQASFFNRLPSMIIDRVKKAHHSALTLVIPSTRVPFSFPNSITPFPMFQCSARTSINNWSSGCGSRVVLDALLSSRALHSTMCTLLHIILCNVLQCAPTCSNVQRDDGQSSGPGLALTLREGAI